MKTLRTRDVLLWSIVVAFAMFGLQWMLRGFWEPDEPRFVLIAKEMEALGSYFIPIRNGVVYAHKPPFMMWLIMLGTKIAPLPFGARLPCMLGAVFAIYSVFQIARRHFSQRVGIESVLVMLGSWGVAQLLGRGQIDSVLLGLVLLAVNLLDANAARIASGYSPGGSWRLLICAFIAMGFAVFAKGPVGYVIPLGSYLVFSRSIGRRTRNQIGFGVSKCLLLTLMALLIPAIWLVGAKLSGGSEAYFNEILFKQTVSRAGGGYGHVRPFYYLVLMFFSEAAPWCIALPYVIYKWKGDKKLLDGLIAWLLFVVLFFSIPSSKRGVYIVSAVAPASIIVAAGLDALISRRKLIRLICIALAIQFIVGSIVFPCMNKYKSPYQMRALAKRYVPEGGRVLLDNINGENLVLYSGVFGTRVNLPEGTEEDCIDAAADEPMLEAMRSEGRGLVVFPSRRAHNLEERFPGMIRATDSFRMGGKSYVWANFETDTSK